MSAPLPDKTWATAWRRHSKNTSVPRARKPRRPGFSTSRRTELQGSGPSAGRDGTASPSRIPP
eukprot:6320117-Pyramimonas_sp.AAC.1